MSCPCLCFNQPIHRKNNEGLELLKAGCEGIHLLLGTTKALDIIFRILYSKMREIVHFENWLSF